MPSTNQRICEILKEKGYDVQDHALGEGREPCLPCTFGLLTAILPDREKLEALLAADKDDIRTTLDTMRDILGPFGWEVGFCQDANSYWWEANKEDGELIRKANPRSVVALALMLDGKQEIPMPNRWSEEASVAHHRV